MKRFFLLLAACGLLATAPTLAQTTDAQQADTRKAAGSKVKKSPEDRAAQRTERMTRELSLTPEQAARVRELNARLAADMDELRPPAAEQAQRKARREKARATHSEYETQLKGILTTEQYARYEQQRQERKEKIKSRHGRRK